MTKLLTINSNDCNCYDSSSCHKKRVLKKASDSIIWAKDSNSTDSFIYSNENSPAQNTENEGKHKSSKKALWIKVGIAAAIVVAGAIILKKTGASDKIKDFFKGQNLVDANNKELFPFAEKHTLKAPGGVFAEDGLVITHLTDHLPNTEGYIDTARSAVGGARDSVHFAVNHGVTPHLVGNWNDKSLAVIMPMDRALNTAGNKFIGGVAGDFYSMGRVKIPQGSVLVRYNEAIPAGKYRISDVKKIKELKKLKGIKLIETSAKNMKKTVDNVIQKMGYELKDASEAYYWGDASSKTKFREFKRFNEFLKAHGMIPMMHMNTPNGKTEMLIENIMTRASLGRGWTFTNEGGKTYNVKKEMLELIKYIENYAKRTKYPVSMDLHELEKIIATSATPQESAQKIKELMKITSSMNVSENIAKLTAMEPQMQEFNLVSMSKMLVGGRGVYMSDEAMLKHLAHPSNKTYTSIVESGFSTLNDLVQFVREFNLKDAVVKAVDEMVH